MESGMGPAAPNMSSIDMCSKASSSGEVSLSNGGFSVIRWRFRNVLNRLQSRLYFLLKSILV